jgi:glutamate synthase (NADPH/NADH) large chain
MASAHPNPRRQGLYDPALEHDACGIALVADLRGRRSHAMVDRGLTALEHLAHRGATGAEVSTGDGAGILLQMPDRFLRAVLPDSLPEPGAYAAGLVFLPTDPDDAAKAQHRVEELARQEGLVVAAWRDVPVDAAQLGESALRAMPVIRQVVAHPPQPPRDAAAEPDALGIDRLAFCLRKRIEHEVPGVYLPSLSARTIVYKGMLTGHQLRAFYPDLSDERVESGIALVHSRFSTNTFPSWPLAHPYRYLAHNGEINTLRGNRNWMRAREALLRSALIPGDLERLFPICDPQGSDSASFDEALELLHLGGRPLPHAVLMMIPEAWENH